MTGLSQGYGNVFKDFKLGLAWFRPCLARCRSTSLRADHTKSQKKAKNPHVFEIEGIERIFIHLLNAHTHEDNEM